MYRNVIKSCRTAQQNALAERLFEEVRPLYVPALATQAPGSTAANSQAPAIGGRPLRLPVDPLVFCEMMIVYKELDRPSETIAAVADLFQLAYPVDAARVLAAAASTAFSGSAHGPAGRWRTTAFKPRASTSPAVGRAMASVVLASAKSLAQLLQTRRVWDASVEGRILRLLCAARFRLSHWDEVNAVLDVMVAHNVEPTRLVYNLGISASIKRADADRAIGLFERMLTHCTQPPSQVRKPLRCCDPCFRGWR